MKDILYTYNGQKQTRQIQNMILGQNEYVNRKKLEFKNTGDSPPLMYSCDKNILFLKILAELCLYSDQVTMLNSLWSYVINRYVYL